MPHNLKKNQVFKMKQGITRRAKRYPVHLEVKELNGQPVAATYLIDISTLGARLESPTPLTPMDQVELSFHQPNADSETRLAGVIVWVQAAAGKTGHYHMGIKFHSAFLFQTPGTMTRPGDQVEPAENPCLVAFLGSKGGVGNTFLTINVAYLLAKEKMGKVLVVDLDLLYGQATYFLDAKPKHSLIDVIENCEDLDSSYLLSLLHNHNENLSLLPAPLSLEDAESVTPLKVKKILHYLQSLHVFKWILLDCPHQMGEVTLTALESSDDIFLVTVPSLPALYNAKKLLKLLDLLGKEKSKTSIILNSLQKQTRVSDSEVQEFLGRGISCRIGFDPTHVENSIDEGRPLGAIAFKVAMSMGLKNIADRLIGNDNSRKTGRWSRIKDIINR
jgi:Flp pilus assembly CpaE family ATPase